MANSPSYSLSKDSAESLDQPAQQYFHITTSKFVLMSLCTFGIYTMYWNYRNWKYIKLRDQSSIWPFWRCVFYPIWLYPLLSDINRHALCENLNSKVYRVTLTAAVFILSAAWRQPDPYWLVSFLSFLPMLPAVRVIDTLNAPVGRRGHQANSHRQLNYVVYALGGPLVVYMVASAFYFVPSTMVVSGDRLWDKDIAMLRENGVLGPEEEIIYFYSAGMFSVREDGQFISDEFVTSYVLDPEDGELYMAYAAYEDIVEIEVDWAETWIEDTIVIVTPDTESPFEIWLSPESGGDDKFVSALDRLWRERGGPGIGQP